MSHDFPGGSQSCQLALFQSCTASIVPTMDIFLKNNDVSLGPYFSDRLPRRAGTVSVAGHEF